MAERVVVNPEICGGHPVARGTRITVQRVLAFLAAGDPPEEALAEYPSLRREDIQACLGYASRLMGNRFPVAALHCVDAQSGQACWTHELDGEAWASPLAADGKVYLGTRGGNFYVFAASRE